MIFLFRFFKFLQYQWRAKNAHGIHSPFVFDLYNEVINQRGPDLSAFDEIKREYLNNQDVISFLDPKTKRSTTSSIGKLTRKTWAGHSFSTFLVRLSEHLNITHILETGTSLGINTSYLSFASKVKSIHTIEGADEIAKMAKKLITARSGIDIKVIHGNVYDIFEESLHETKPELIFLDADHRSETIAFYLNSIKNHHPNVTCVIVHDIYWSQDMMYAWKLAVKDPDYPLTIDIFNAGLIFPNVKMEKQHFILKH